MNTARSVRQVWAPSPAIAIAIMAGLSLLLFAGPLLSGRIVSAEGQDLHRQDAYWRMFGYAELRQGNFALWNPHIFGGAPFFGGWQSGLLYPLNLHYLVLPLASAINLGVCLHVFLAGLFTHYWARRRGLHPLACLVSATLFMFCGPHFLHVYAGHLGRLCAIAWAPAILMAVDALMERATLRMALFGALAFAMQILGGDPQYVLYTGVAAAIWIALRTARGGFRPAFLKGAAACLAMTVAAALLGAVQIFSALDATAGSIRGAGVGRSFAAIFSFPPENLLTLVCPGFFGDLTRADYWGRWYLWEMSLFFGLAGLCLAVYAAVRRERAARRFEATMVAILFLLALGSYTPLFDLLYRFAPGFDKFRGMSKFTLPMVAFCALLAGIGLDRLIQRPAEGGALAVSGLAAGIALAIAAIVVAQAADAAPEGFWSAWLRSFPAPLSEGPSAQPVLQDAEFQRQAGRFASRMLWLSSAGMLALAWLFRRARASSWAIHALAAFALAEMFLFAANSRATFDPAHLRLPRIEQGLAADPGDYRVVNTVLPNLPMATGGYGAWGYGPIMAERCAQLFCMTQGTDPDYATQHVVYTSRTHPLLRLLRCRYWIAPDPQRQDTVTAEPMPGALPRVMLMRRVQVARGRDVLMTMNRTDFDPATTVILEEEPDPPPAPGGPDDYARVEARTSDSLTVSVMLSAPAVLLITDAWYPGWRATDADDPQTTYRILPGDWALQAIPLPAGMRRIRLEYRPAAFTAGAWISGLSAAALAGLAAWEWRRSRKGRREQRGRAQT